MSGSQKFRGDTAGTPHPWDGLADRLETRISHRMCYSDEFCRSGSHRVQGIGRGPSAGVRPFGWGVADP